MLRFLLEAGSILEASLDYETTLKELGHLVVPRLADWYSVDLVDAGGRATSVAVEHVDPTKVELAREMRRRYPADPRSPTGAVAVARTGRSEWFPDITDEMIDQAVSDPELRETVRGLGLRSAVTVPLVARGQTLGALALVAAESGRRYTQADVRLIEELGKRAGIAIDNARLFAAERQANQRVSLISRAASRLAESLDEQTALGRLAELMTEELADFCLVDVLDEDGTIRRDAAVHRDPALGRVMEQLMLRPPDPEGSIPAAVAIRTRSVVFAEVTEEVLASIASDEEHLDLMRQIGGLNFVAVPLVARDHVLGAVTIASTTLRYGDEDIELALELAGRAALLVDNTRLYEAQARAARQSARLQAIVDATFSSHSVDGLLHEILERITEVMDTDLAAILLMEEEEPVLRMRAAVGLSDDVVRDVRVPLGRGFAGRIAATRQPLAVEEVPSFGVVSAYLRERVRSIVGVPLMQGGEVVGVLHTSTLTPRTFVADDVTLLQLAAERAAAAIRRAELYERQEEIATLLQRSLLPDELPAVPGVEFGVLFRAAGRGVEVGGDFYDAFPLSEGAWGLLVGDVCGRGPRAAAVTALARNAIRTIAMRGATPREALQGANDIMIRTGAERFCTAVYVEMRPDDAGASMVIARAGHPPAMVVRCARDPGGIPPRGRAAGRLPGGLVRGGAGPAGARRQPGPVHRRPGGAEPRPAGTRGLARLLRRSASLDAGGDRRQDRPVSGLRGSALGQRYRRLGHAGRSATG